MPQVRVIGEDSEQLGVMDVRDAIRTAREKGLDLVEIAPNGDPPVCRIIDFGKFQYEAKKKANEAKKKQVTVTVKEVKFRPGTDEHDYSYRMKHAREWLQEGDKVKATIWFRGREMTHRELGSRILEKLEKDLSDVGEVEARPRMEAKGARRRAVSCVGQRSGDRILSQSNRKAVHRNRLERPGIRCGLNRLW